MRKPERPKLYTFEYKTLKDILTIYKKNFGYVTQVEGENAKKLLEDLLLASAEEEQQILASFDQPIKE